MREASFTKALTVAFTKETFAKIKAITDQKRISMGEWVRIAAEKALADEDYFECSEGGKRNEF
jgi:hypothetical protein